jgi:hypothetical protein
MTCTECGGTGVYPKSGEPCYACPRPPVYQLVSACAVCGQEFRSDWALRSHKKVHSPQAERRREKRRAHVIIKDGATHQRIRVTR